MNKYKDIPQELFDAIKRYINGNMEPDELKDFNDYLKIDAEFKKQVEDIKTDLLSEEHKESLKKEPNSSYKNIQQPEVIKSSSKKKPLLNISKLTLVIASIIAVGSIWFFSISPNEKIYKKYFKPESGLQRVNTISNPDFFSAMEDYQNGNYKFAIKKWLNINKNKPNNDTLNYFLGVAKMANNNVAEAIPFLERCITKKSFFLLDNAYYYLGLAYLNEGNTELAKKYLNLTTNDSSEEILSMLMD